MRRRRTRRRGRRPARCSCRPTARACSSRAPPYDRNPEPGRAEDLHRQGGDQDRREDRASTRATTTNVYERVTAVLDADAGRFIVARESPTEVPQSFLVDGTRRIQLTKNQDYTPDITKARIERFTVERPDGFKFRVTVNLPQDYQAGTRLPAIFWFYPARVPGPGLVRSPRSHVQQERLPHLRHAVDGVLRPSRLRGRRARLARSSVREGQMNDNYVHDLRNNLSAVIDELDRRALVDRDAAGDRRPQLRRVLDGQRDGAHAVLQGGHRRRRRLQPHADADRLPDRASRPVGSAARLPEHVAVPVREPPDRRAADVSRPRRPERRHGSDQLAAALPRAERAREDDGAVPVSARGSRPGGEGDAARPVGALGGVARQVREECHSRRFARRRRRITTSSENR